MVSCKEILNRLNRVTCESSIIHDKRRWPHLRITGLKVSQVILMYIKIPILVSTFEVKMKLTLCLTKEHAIKANLLN
jgi:hypothetical protein